MEKKFEYIVMWVGFMTVQIPFNINNTANDCIKVDLEPVITFLRWFKYEFNFNIEKKKQRCLYFIFIIKLK